MNLLFAIERYTDLVTRSALQGHECLYQMQHGGDLQYIYTLAAQAWHFALESEKVRL